MNNLLSIVYSTGAKGVVLSNKFFEQELAMRDAKIDALKAKLVPEDVKELQRRKDDPANKEELTTAERQRIGRGMAEIYQDVTLQRLMEERANFTESALHKISSKVVKELVARHIEGMVIGHNDGWKTESNMGRVNNRRFHRSAHTRLIELIRYKAEEHGILIVETEESYTSKTSFVDNETLQSKTQPVCESHKVALLGKRRQHTFKSASLLSRWQKYHADINGAFNILRKVFAQFVWHSGLTPKYRLWTFSHKRGAYALQ
jgi:putative transposase